MNNINLIGRTTSDVDLRYTPNQTAVVNGTLAVPRNRKNAQGERPTDFIKFVVWGKNAENFANWIKKGYRVSIAGELQTRDYENNSGQKVYVSEVNVDSWENLTPKTDTNGNQNNFGEPEDNGFGLGQVEPYPVSEDGLPF